MSMVIIFVRTKFIHISYISLNVNINKKYAKLTTRIQEERKLLLKKKIYLENHYINFKRCFLKNQNLSNIRII